MRGVEGGQRKTRWFTIVISALEGHTCPETPGEPFQPQSSRVSEMDEKKKKG